MKSIKVSRSDENVKPSDADELRNEDWRLPGCGLRFPETTETGLAAGFPPLSE
jgi:hypothetical protein